MNPNQQTPLTTEYLDEIATPAQASSGPPLKKILIFGGIAVVVVLGLLYLFTSLSKGQLTTTERLAGRLYSTNQIVEDTVKRKLIKDTKLLAINTTLALTLKNIIRDTTPGFAAKNIKYEKLKDNKKILAKENSTELAATLEDARLNGNFDQVYTIEMTHSLVSLKLLMEQVSKKTNNVSMQSALITGVEDLSPLIEQFEAFGIEARPAL